MRSMTSMVRLRRTVHRLVCAVLLLILAPDAASGEEEAAARGTVFLAAIEGPIGPASVRHVDEAIETAEERDAAALVLRLNTPGGLADSTRESFRLTLEDLSRGEHVLALRVVDAAGNLGTGRILFQVD